MLVWDLLGLNVNIDFLSRGHGITVLKGLHEQHGIWSMAWTYLSSLTHTRHVETICRVYPHKVRSSLEACAAMLRCLVVRGVAKLPATSCVKTTQKRVRIELAERRIHDQVAKR